MKIKLTTTINYSHFAGEAITYVPDCYVELFEPVNEVDDDYEPLGIGDEPTEAKEYIGQSLSQTKAMNERLSVADNYLKKLL